MSNFEFTQQMHEYSRWRKQFLLCIEKYLAWRQRYHLNDPQSTQTILNLLQGLKSDRITLAFVAEVSRGKTELINALFFAETGFRLLPSAPGRTTMCPTELFYDPQGNYIRLLNIDTRLESASLNELKQMPARWTQIELDSESPTQMQQAFQELVTTKKVTPDVAYQLGLWNPPEINAEDTEIPEYIEIPCWRHALISFPHPLLRQGLIILDTPGLNALGTEPELTLAMLPSAQAILFVLAADTGVSKSDLELWRDHVCSTRGHSKQGLAVIMNKIDTVCDELSDERTYNAQLSTQAHNSAQQLGINESLVLPVSAKQGLLAKIKSDSHLLAESRISSIEHFLSQNILKQRRQLLTNIIKSDLGYLLGDSIKQTENKLQQKTAELDELKKTDFENAELIEKLMEETRQRQIFYNQNLEQFRTSSKLFDIQCHVLIDSLSRERIDRILQTSRLEIAKSTTTYGSNGIKQNIRKLFSDLRLVLQDAIQMTEETRKLVLAIHKKFQDEHEENPIEPQVFSIRKYQTDLERIIQEGEAFASSYKTTFTRQSLIVDKLYETLVARARNVLMQAHQDAVARSQFMIKPLKQRLKEHKKQTESRLHMLYKIHESKHNIAENIQRLEQELHLLQQQHKELQTIASEVTKNS